MAYNSVTYLATGTNYKFRNPYYVSDVATYIKVYKNDAELSSPADFTWLETDWGISLVVVPAEDARIKIEDREHEVTEAVDEDSTLVDCIAGVGTNRGLIETNITDIETLETADSDQQVEIDRNESDITDAELDIAANSALIAGNTSDISDLETADSSQQSEIDANTSDIAALSDQAAAVAALEAEQTVQDGRLLANEADIATNILAIDVLEDRVEVVEAATGLNTSIGRSSITNNQAVLGDLLAEAGQELAVDSDVEHSVKLTLEVHRKTDSEERFCVYDMYMQWMNNQWYIGNTAILIEVGAVSGVSFDIAMTGNDVGQLQYTSDNMAGTNYEGTFRWRLVRLRNTL